MTEEVMPPGMYTNCAVLQRSDNGVEGTYVPCNRYVERWMCPVHGNVRAVQERFWDTGIRTLEEELPG